MSRSSIEYHQRELNIALDPSNPNHLIPSIGNAESVLDIGCGAGQTLIALAAGRRRVGIDIDIKALAFGLQSSAGASGVQLAAARGEQLPFQAGSFDFVCSRVALPYMNIVTALSEMRRVLRTGGHLWLTLHPIGITTAQFRRGNLKGKIYASYVILNGLWFHLSGRTFPFLRGVRESFQTERGMRMALLRAGFSNVEFRKTPHHFIVTAERIS
jgi:ubiquinone/menaquinone biosynthesis C-methylase UbiE